MAGKVRAKASQLPRHAAGWDTSLDDIDSHIFVSLLAMEPRRRPVWSAQIAVILEDYDDFTSRSSNIDPDISIRDICRHIADIS